MVTLTGLIPVTVGTFETYHGGGGGGDTIGRGGGGGWERRAQDHIYIYTRGYLFFLRAVRGGGEAVFGAGES